MSTKSYEQDDTVVIMLEPDIKGKIETSEFKSILLQFLKNDKKNIVVDMSDVKYLSSSGIALLISGYKIMTNSGGNLKLAQISEKVAGLFSLTKLNRVFETYDSVDTAIQSYRNVIAQ